MKVDELPPDWKIVRLGAYIHKPDYGYTTSAIVEPNGPKFLRITDIQDSVVNWERVPYCICDDDTRKNYLLKPGDLVIARIGATTGKAYLIRDCPETIFASYLIRMRTKSGLVPEFLSFYCETEDYWKQIDQNKGGRLKGGVNIPILQNLFLLLPPLPEQHAIARTLRTAQAAIEARRRELELEHERKAALMEHLFTHGTRGEKTKQTDIGEVPESWEVVRLEDVALEIGSGITPRGGEKTYLKDGIPLIRSQNVLMTDLSLSDVAYISHEIHNSMSRSSVRPGDVLLNITGASIGRVAYVPESLEVANVNQHVCRIRFESGINGEFISFFLASSKGQSQIMGSQFGTTRQGLNYGNVRAIRIPRPLLFEQDQAAEVLRDCHSKIKALQREIILYEELFRALIEELMTGRLRTTSLIS